MGKKSKKIKKIGHKEAKNKIAEALLTEIAQHMENEEYNLVLECVAELIRNKVYDAEAMYAGAYSYFRLGDYERAADWVNNTLTYDSNHLLVRVLLGHLCLLEDRVDDAMSLYEYVLEHGGNKLDSSVIEEITSIGEGYAGQKARSIEGDYPEIAKLIGYPVNTDRMVERDSKEKITDKQEIKEDVEAICQKIMKENEPLSYKVKMLNTFAGGFYLNGQLQEAETLLLTALKIDSTSNVTLRNMAIVQIDLGCKDKAEKLLAEMSVPDFVLLKMIQSC